jgi:5-methylcytosine-specific restriction endonuclease McrA
VRAKAATICVEPGCPKVATKRGRCERHPIPREPWQQSEERRRARGLPPKHVWRKLTRQVRERDRHRCRCGRYVPRGRGAVDHRLPLYLGGRTVLENLELRCDECHAAKTKLESADARRRADARRADARRADARPMQILPTYAELNSAIDTIGDLFKRYYTLVTVESYLELVPTPQYDWEAVFREPWILPADGRRDAH